MENGLTTSGLHCKPYPQQFSFFVIATVNKNVRRSKKLVRLLIANSSRAIHTRTYHFLQFIT